MQDSVQQRGRVQSAPHLRLLTWQGSDAELLELVALRDQAAAARFHDRFASDVHALVRALVGPHAAHARLVERSLLRAYRGLATSDVSVGQLPGWVEKYAVRTARSYLRFRRWGRWLPDRGNRSERRSPKGLAAFFERLGELRPDAQIAFCLRYVAGRALSDSARLCECSVHDLRGKLRTAEDHLKALPEGLLDEELPEVGWGV